MFSKGGIVYCLDNLGVQNFHQIALSPAVQEIETIMYFVIFGKKYRKFLFKRVVVFCLDTLGVKNFEDYTFIAMSW